MTPTLRERPGLVSASPGSAWTRALLALPGRLRQRWNARARHAGTGLRDARRGALLDAAFASAPDVVGVAAIVDDVTELKRAEGRLQEALASEYQSRAFLDTLLDHAPLSLTFVDRELRYSLVNQLAASVTGRSREDMLGRTVEEVYPELAPVIIPALERVLETGVPLIGHEVQDTDPVTGGDRFWLVSRFPVRIHGGIVGVTSIRAEVTPLKQLEEQLERDLLAAADAEMYRNKRARKRAA